MGSRIARLSLSFLIVALVSCDSFPAAKRQAPPRGKPPLAMPSGTPEGTEYALGCEPGDAILVESALWITCASGPLLRIDPSTGRTLARIDLGTADGRIPGSGHAIAHGLGGLWLANPVGTDDDPIPPHSFSGGIGLIDPATNRILRTLVFVDRTPIDVAVGAKHVWLSTGSTITLIDPSSLRVAGTITFKGAVGSIGATTDAIWTVAPDENGRRALLRIDQSNGRVVRTLLADRNPFDVLATEGAVWVLVDDGAGLVRVDPRSNEVVASSALPAAAFELAVGDGAIWASDYDEGILFRLDPDTLAVTGQINAGRYPANMVFGDGVVWVTNYVDQVLRRIELSPR